MAILRRIGNALYQLLVSIICATIGLWMLLSITPQGCEAGFLAYFNC